MSFCVKITSVTNYKAVLLSSWRIPFLSHRKICIFKSEHGLDQIVLRNKNNDHIVGRLLNRLYIFHKTHISIFERSFTWKSRTCSWFNSPNAIPPDINTVAVSGTRKTYKIRRYLMSIFWSHLNQWFSNLEMAPIYTFHPMLSKNVANFDWPVVFPPQGPPVKTSL